MINFSSALRAPFARLLPSWTGRWAKDSALLLVSQGLTLVATSVSAILIARRLEPAEWGIFTAFLGLSFALAVFVEFGLSTWLLRELSALFTELGDRAEEPARELTAAGLAFAGTMTVMVVGLATPAAVLHGESPVLVVTLAMLLAYGAMAAAANVTEAHLRARRRLRRVVAVSIVEKWLLVALIVAALVLTESVWAIALAYLCAGALRLVLLFLSVFGMNVPGRPPLREIKDMLRRSLPFAFASGSLMVIPRLDALILLTFTATIAGYYALADRVLTPIGLAAVIGGTALYPFLAKASVGPRAIWGLSGGLAAAGAGLAAIGVFVAPELVPLVFGGQYEDAVTTVRVMLLALPLIYAASPLLPYCYSSGRERAVAGATWAGCLSGSGAILAGAAIAGAPGAAAGFVVRQVILLGMFIAIALSVQRKRLLVVVPVPAAPDRPLGW